MNPVRVEEAIDRIQLVLITKGLDSLKKKFGYNRNGQCTHRSS